MSNDPRKEIAFGIMNYFVKRDPSINKSSTKKQRLAQIITEKVDRYSTFINENNISEMFKRITAEIMNGATTNNMAQLQEERNKIGNRRPITQLERPIPQQNNRQTTADRFAEIEQSRNLEMGRRLQRPPTPDFLKPFDENGSQKRSNDKISNKSNKNNQKQKNEPKMNVQERLHADPNQISNEKNKFSLNQQGNTGIIGANELDDAGFTPFDTDNIKEISNLDERTWVTGINKKDYEKAHKDEHLKSTNTKYQEYSGTYKQNSLSNENKSDPDNMFDKLNDQINIKKKQSKTQIEESDQYSMSDHKNDDTSHKIHEMQVPSNITKKLHQLENENKEQSTREEIDNQDDNDESRSSRNIIKKMQQIENENNKLRQALNQKHDNDIAKIEEFNIIKEQTIKDLKEKTLQLKLQENELTEFEKSIKRTISNNITKFANESETIIINSLNTILPRTIKNITSIELKEFDLPFEKNNITPTNCQLRFNIPNNKIINIDNEDPNIDITINENDIMIDIVPGKYTIDDLVGMINKLINKLDITLHNKNNSYAILKSKSKFDIIVTGNSLFPNLGFLVTATNKNKHVGTQHVDLEYDKFVNLFITNINNDIPVMQYIIGSQNQSKIISFDPVIKELTNINLKILNSKGDIYNPIMNFSVQLVIHYINNKQNAVKNNLNHVDSDEEVDIIKVASL